MSETKGIPDPLRLPFKWSNCPFCWKPVHKQYITDLGDGRFRYENNCSCLDYAQGVVEADGSHYWEVVKFSGLAAFPAAKLNRIVAEWEHWQQNHTDSEEPDDVKVYEEAQIILRVSA